MSKAKIRKDTKGHVISCAMKQNEDGSWTNWLCKGDKIAFDVNKDTATIGTVVDFFENYNKEIVVLLKVYGCTCETERRKFFHELEQGQLRRITNII